MDRLILPERPGLPSGYEQKFFAPEDKRGKLRLVASPDGAEGSVKVQQDARLYASIVKSGDAVAYTLPEGRKGWLHVVRGQATLNGQTLGAGDGVAIEGKEALTLGSPDEGEVLLFDMVGK